MKAYVKPFMNCTVLMPEESLAAYGSGGNLEDGDNDIYDPGGGNSQGGGNGKGDGNSQRIIVGGSIM